MTSLGMQWTIVGTQLLVNLAMLLGFAKSAYNGIVREYAQKLDKIDDVEQRLGTLEQLVIYTAPEEDQRVIEVAVERDELNHDILTRGGADGMDE